MPVRQADADDADDATHHGKRGGVSWYTEQPEPVTILKPMCRINMTPEGDPQVALAASQADAIFALWARLRLSGSPRRTLFRVQCARIHMTNDLHGSGSTPHQTTHA